MQMLFFGAVLFGQLPGADRAVEAAMTRSWEAVLLVVIVVAVFTFFGWTLKKILESTETRETRLANRVTALETEIRNELFSQVKANTEVMARMVDAAVRISTSAERMIASLDRFESTLLARPCLATMECYARALLDQLGPAVEHGEPEHKPEHKPHP